MKYAGIDYSTQVIDIVLVGRDDDTDVTWHRYPLVGHDWFERCRFVPQALPGRTNELWDDVLGIGIEDVIQRGPKTRSLTSKLRPIMGAILACLPPETMVKPYKPPEWRTAVGLAGNCDKEAVEAWAAQELWHVDIDQRPEGEQLILDPHWPQDAYDAYTIARATKKEAVVAGALL